MGPWRRLGCATAAVTIGMLVSGCAPGESSSLRVATSSTASISGSRALAVQAKRVIADEVDFRQRVYVARDGDAIAVTFAVRARDGITMKLDPRTLRSIGDPQQVSYPRGDADAGVHVDAHEDVIVFTSDERKVVVVGTPEGRSLVAVALQVTP